MVFAQHFALCTALDFGSVVQCTVAVTYGSSLNIAPWPHCTISMFITIITIMSKMNRPVLLGDFQAFAA